MDSLGVDGLAYQRLVGADVDGNVVSLHQLQNLQRVARGLAERDIAKNC